jgi:hypothetical protein
MSLPVELVEISSIDNSLPAEFHWRIVTERRMYTMSVVKIPEFFKLWKTVVRSEGIQTVGSFVSFQRWPG